MICSLAGTVGKRRPHQVRIVVGGVGYLVHVPLTVYEALEEGEKTELLIHSHVREDRFDLFGFRTEEDLTMFQALLAMDGIGPKIALEICSIPKRELHHAVSFSDASVLESVKGIGKKRAEKLLLDLKSFYEKHQDLLLTTDVNGEAGTTDEDAVSALTSLGYERKIVLKALRNLPSSVTKTEDRVTAVLRSL